MSAPLPIPIGKRFGSLVVTGEAPKRNPKCRRVFADCDCGKAGDFDFYYVNHGVTTHCGCLYQKHKAEAMTIHGESKGKVGKALYGIIKRCCNERSTMYRHYGGRGIKICDRWRFGEDGKRGVECFIEDVGKPPTEGHTIDRIDNDGDYEPSNVKWSTRTEQANNRRSSRLITFHGKTQTLAQWSRETGISCSAIASRVSKLNWPLERAFTQTPRRSRR